MMYDLGLLTITQHASDRNSKPTSKMPAKSCSSMCNSCSGSILRVVALLLAATIASVKPVVY
eukprot:11830-Heterococcus_DN1.PRE.7